MYQSPFGISLLTQSDTQVQMGGRAIGLERQRLLEYFNRSGEVAASGKRGA